ncbi:MAG TPA: adenylyl cyclase, partial [Sphingomonas sp.]
MSQPHDRRSVLAGLAGLAAAAHPAVATATRATAPRDPDLGPNVLIVDPAMPAADIQRRVDAIFARMERAQFSDERHAILFKPG